MTPRVSVLVPMRNAEAFIGEALRKLLREHDVPLEVVVVDDGSTDASRARVQALADARLRIIDGPRCGIAAAFNAGLQQARGDIIMRCDADDFYPEDRIQRQVAWLDAHPQFGAVCGKLMPVGTDGRRIMDFDMPSTASEITDELRRGVVRTSFCTFAVRTEVLAAIGGARRYFQTGEDIDLQLRLGELSRVWYSAELCYHYRLHDASITHTRSNAERDFYEEQARIFQRQRQEEGTDDLQRNASPRVLPVAVATTDDSATAHVANLLVGSSWRAHEEGRRFRALALGTRAALARPTALRVWRNLIALALKPSRKRK